MDFPPPSLSLQNPFVQLKVLYRAESAQKAEMSQQVINSGGEVGGAGTRVPSARLSGLPLKGESHGGREQEALRNNASLRHVAGKIAPVVS